MKVASSLGWGASVLGAASLLLSGLTLLQRDPDNQAAPYGFAMFAILFGLPGIVTLWRLQKRQQVRVFRERLLGYVKSYDAFSVEELARKISRSELETEALIAELIQQADLELVFHRKSRQYMHRKRLKTDHKILSRCPACGATLGAQIVFEGESPACQYCDHPLVTSANPEPPSPR